jgi:hypothetical protein
VCEGESGPGCGIEVTAEVSSFPESLIQCHPRSGLIDIVEIYRTCGTEDNVAVESIHTYIGGGGHESTQMSPDKGAGFLEED